MSDRFWLTDAQMAGLAAEHGERKTVMIDATYLKAHPLTGNACLHAREGHGDQFGRQKGGRGRLITARQHIAQQCPERGAEPRAA